MKPRKVLRPSHEPRKRSSPPFNLIAVACLLLSLAILAIYAQTFGYGFVSYDDDRYVYDNPMVKAGLSLHGLIWAFTAFYASNWHPLTWISHMLDYELFGLNAGAGHVVNVILHLGATLILFLALVRMTGEKWRSVFVAAIFGLHPLHVESVAWIAERKDVLSAFFEMLTLLLYVRYVEHPSVRRYAAMALAFALSLLAKPMAVTLPFVLLLLDVWPLHRFNPKRSVWEKIPLLAMSAASSMLAFFAQRTTAMMTLTRLPLADRLANAAFAYLSYIGKAFWPVGLAVLYPLHTPPAAGVIAAALTLAGLTLFAVLGFRRRPYFLVGWFWYLGMLVPVIGLVQVGFQSMADRYTYVPLVGLSIALVWTIGDLCDARPMLRKPAIALGIVASAVLAAGAFQQAKYWRNSVSLYQHTLAVTSGNYVIQNNLAVILESEGREQEAISLFRQAVAAAPDYSSALNNLGAVLARQGHDLEEAIALHQRAVAVAPAYSAARINLGHELLESGQLDAALPQLTQALQLQPDSAPAQADMGTLLGLRGNLEQAAQYLEQSVRLDPNQADIQSNLCIVLLRLNRREQAIAACNAALKINPHHAGALAALASLLRAQH